MQALVAESIYDHWDGILPKFDPDFFCIEVQIAAEVGLFYSSWFSLIVTSGNMRVTLLPLQNGKVVSRSSIQTCYNAGLPQIW